MKKMERNATTLEAVVTVSNWADGQWKYTNEVIDRYPVQYLEDTDWLHNEPWAEEWWWLCECYQNDGYKISEGEDDEYTVTYYEVDEDGGKEEISSYSIWMSDIVEYMTEVVGEEG